MITFKQEKNIFKYNKIWHKLAIFNANNNAALTRKKAYNLIPVNFYAYNGKTLIGGALCFLDLNWLYIDILYVDERMRGQDIGSMLIQKLEEYSAKNHLSGLYVKTFDFQAKPFYEKCGFELLGCLNNMPPNSKTWILKKELKGDTNE